MNSTPRWKMKSWYVRDTAIAALEKLGFTVEFTGEETAEGDNAGAETTPAG